MTDKELASLSDDERKEKTLSIKSGKYKEVICMFTNNKNNVEFFDDLEFDNIDLTDENLTVLTNDTALNYDVK